MTRRNLLEETGGNPRILVVGDDIASDHALVRRLRDAGCETRIAPDGPRAMDLMRSAPPDIILLDVPMPGINGFEFCRRLKLDEHADGIPVIFMIDRSDTMSQSRALRSGGVDFIAKPVQDDEALVRICAHLTIRQLRQSLQEGLAGRHRFGDIIGGSPVMKAVYRTIAKAAGADVGVLISGESGTGKELAARAIHRLSRRQDRPFVAVNCAAVPESLFEREFFGHCRGAFTDAFSDIPGYLAQADGGALLLDEVGELSHAGQIKLLRVLQEKEYYPLGAMKPSRVDLRIIAATNGDLADLMQKGRIREDFYYRIRVIHIHLPPLRQRKEDIPLLVEHFLRQDACGPPASTLPAHMMAMLCAYHWPGNVRELQNELQRWQAGQALECAADPMEDLDGKAPPVGFDPDPGNGPLRNALMSFEKLVIARTLQRCGGSTKMTAEALDIPLRTLQRKIRNLGL